MAAKSATSGENAFYSFDRSSVERAHLISLCQRLSHQASDQAAHAYDEDF